MTQIIANNPGGQMIFNTYIECSKYMEQPQSKIIKAIMRGEPVTAPDGQQWWLDRLYMS